MSDHAITRDRPTFHAHTSESTGRVEKGATVALYSCSRALNLLFIAAVSFLNRARISILQERWSLGMSS